MPRRKRSAADGTATSVSSKNYIAPGGGTTSDMKKLSRTLNLPIDAIAAVMNCGGQGVASSRSSRRSGGGNEAVGSVGGAAAAAAVDPAMMNVWGDFMSEEMSATPASAATASSASSAAAPVSTKATTANSPKKDKPATVSPSEPASGPRNYVLPILPKMRLGKKSTNDADNEGVPTPGLLAQTGTLDASVPGRSSISKSPLPHELLAPTLLFPKSIFANTKIAFITSSPTACHSIAITSSGTAYGWGRNETGQLGLGYSSAVVPLPTPLSVNDESVKFVGAAVGKYHTILVGSNGMAYASGGNVNGQLGINNAGAKGVDKFRKCVVMGQINGGGEEEEGTVKIVQVSFTGLENAILSLWSHVRYDLILFGCSAVRISSLRKCWHLGVCVPFVTITTYPSGDWLLVPFLLLMFVHS
mmetsp:Transcript_8637/g.15615  ORF Transcript_8637/g.15615 Transcript_8637/m.15615 type:complete len:416 (+) Transcript_8637:101-1348(+)